MLRIPRSGRLGDSEHSGRSVLDGGRGVRLENWRPHQGGDGRGGPHQGGDGRGGEGAECVETAEYVPLFPPPFLPDLLEAVGRVEPDLGFYLRLDILSLESRGFNITGVRGDKILLYL